MAKDKHNCKVIKDFEPFKVGEEYETIYISYEKGLMEGLDDEGVLVKSVKLSLSTAEDLDNDKELS